MPKKIVVIDDDPLIRALVVEILSPSYGVLAAEDGEAGVALVRKERPDLVICDFAMPRMHGFEVCRLLRADASLAGLKILMCSSKSYAQDVVNAKSVGADDYLVKPYEVKALTEKVAALLRP
jgi:DNA-binding response OmpR family regulator